MFHALPHFLAFDDATMNNSTIYSRDDQIAISDKGFVLHSVMLIIYFKMNLKKVGSLNRLYQPHYVHLAILYELYLSIIIISILNSEFEIL